MKLLLALCIIILSQTAHAEWTNKNKAIAAGQYTYYRFCSICHGQDAKGGGQFAENLKAAPSDLTQLNAINDGLFPWLHLYEVIDGKDAIDEHGTREMPIWGDMFDISQWPNQYDGFADVIVRGRIFELLIYLESIQEQ